MPQEVSRHCERSFPRFSRPDGRASPNGPDVPRKNGQTLTAIGRRAAMSQYRVTHDATLTPAERAAVNAGPAVAECGKYVPYSTAETELRWAKAYDGDALVAIAPVVRLRKRKGTDLLRQPLRK